MLWFKKQQPKGIAAVDTNDIVPAELALPLDSAYFMHKFSALQANTEGDGGVEVLVTSLVAKHQLFARLLDVSSLPSLQDEDLESLLDTVFSARRRLYPDLKAFGLDKTKALIHELLFGNLTISERLSRFADMVQVNEADDREARKLAAKNKRAAYDFGAEILHFSQPDKFPLMTRWVWDQQAQSGALREFIRGNDAMDNVSLGNAPEMFEGARVWLAAQLAEQGLYRDIPQWIDLVMAQAYTEYFRSMAEGMLSSEFGRGSTPGEHLKKFLGIDAPIKEGRSRVKRITVQ